MDLYVGACVRGVLEIPIWWRERASDVSKLTGTRHVI